MQDAYLQNVSEIYWPSYKMHQAPVVQTLNSAIHRINHYPADSVIDFHTTYPLDSDLSGGQRYPTFEQPGPDDDSIQILLNCTVYKTVSGNLFGSTLWQCFVFFIILQKETYKLSVILSMPYLGSEMPLGAGQTFTVVYYLCKGARKKKETKIKRLNLYLIKCNNQLHRVGWEPVGSIADYSCLFIHY